MILKMFFRTLPPPPLHWADVLRILTPNLGVFKNLHVLLWRRINDTEKILSQQLQNGNKSIVLNICKDFNQNFYRYFFCMLRKNNPKSHKKLHLGKTLHSWYLYRKDPIRRDDLCLVFKFNPSSFVASAEGFGFFNSTLHGNITSLYFQNTVYIFKTHWCWSYHMRVQFFQTVISMKDINYFPNIKNSSYIFTMRAVQYSIVTFYKITLLITDLKMLSLEDRVLLPLAEACKHGQRIK